MSIRDMINSIAAGSKAEASKIFQDEMMEKIQDAVQVERVRVAANFLQPADEVVEESVEIEEETLNEEEMTHAHAKDAAHQIAKAHKNLKVSSFGNDHYVHHKDDEDGADGTIHVKADGGHLHVTSEMGAVGGTKKHKDVASAVAHGTKDAVGS